MKALESQFYLKRDIANFIFIRSAIPGDDLQVGDLLAYSYLPTEKNSLQAYEQSESEQNLRDVRTKRVHGIVRVLELGYKVIGTYTLIPPNSSLDESWTYNTATLCHMAIDPDYRGLRLSINLLNDAIEVARKWQVEKICIQICSDALNIARLFEKFGFIRDKIGDMNYFSYKMKGYSYPLA
ncbi:MAG: GNAT family N-acetyltransferase [Oligoflexia bacterium]|nr:GNAT family N-acetyltransferase [Oligoflexia bacterium]